MNTCAIVFFPQNNTEYIQEFRKSFDPKFNLILPHITLVFRFPFPENEEHIFTEIGSKLKKYQPFNVDLAGFHLDPNDHLLHLLVRNGKEKIITMYDDLYSGVLEPYWRKDIPYTPHMTIGDCANTNGVLDEKKYVLAQTNAGADELRTSFHFDSVSIIKIEDQNTPRTIIRTFNL
jgi:2'-5' RNA ligase